MSYSKVMPMLLGFLAAVRGTEEMGQRSDSGKPPREPGIGAALPLPASFHEASLGAAQPES